MVMSKDTQPPPPDYNLSDTVHDSQQETPPYQNALSTPHLRMYAFDEPIRPVFHQRTDDKKSFYTARIFIAGDARVGKSTLMQSYRYYDEPHRKDNRRVNACYIKMQGPERMPFLLKLLHVSLRGDLEEIYQKKYLSVAEDLILLCFAKDNLESLFNIKKVWYPLVKLLVNSGKIPVILVGTKWDKTSHIPDDLVLQVAKEIGATALIECSSEDRSTVRKVVDVALQFLHEEWASGLNKVFQKSLELENFEARVLKEGALEIEFGESCRVTQPSQDHKQALLLDGEVREVPNSNRKQNAAMNTEKVGFNGQRRKQKSKGDCTVM